MHPLTHLCRASSKILTPVIAWLGFAQSAWAAAGAPEVVEKSYVKSFAIVVLGCLLGLLIVCRSAHRTTEVQYDDDDN